MLVFVHMGAGKGQLRRANKAVTKTSAKKDTTLRYNEHKWYDWMESLSALDVSIVDFYRSSTKLEEGSNCSEVCAF